jgi:hypothetical protein
VEWGFGEKWRGKSLYFVFAQNRPIPASFSSDILGL